MTKKIIYLIHGILLMSLVFTSCKLDDNINPKQASNVKAGTLLTNAQIRFVNQYDNSSVNVNISRFLAQYWTATTYTGECRYNFQDRGIPDTYTAILYRDVLMDLFRAKEIIEKGLYPKEQKANMLGILEVMQVATYANLTETFGNLPYAQALKGLENTTPAYEDAATIYKDLFTRLDKAIANFDVNKNSFGSADLFFGGDVSAWKLYANSLKLRMGMRMADVPSFNSKSVVEAAVKAGVYKDQANSFIFKYIGTAPYVNTINKTFIINGREDKVPANTIINKMVELNDPRLPLWFTKLDGKYVGLEYGKKQGGNYVDFSHFAERFFAPTFPVIIIDYVEMEFFLAEAVERGYAVGGTAEEHYNNAIKASILYNGGTAEDADAYLAQPAVKYDASNWKKTIGNQKWIAMYNRGVEGWTEWRRLDFPVLNVPEGMTYEDIPVRYPYPYDESKLNNANYKAASEAIGGNSATTRLWWDKAK